MKQLHVTLAQLVPKLGDKASNYEMIVKTMNEAKKQGSQLVVFPELFLTGYSIGEKVSEVAETMEGSYIRKIRELCKQLQINTVISYPESDGTGNYYITSSYIDDQGNLLGSYRKIHLFDQEKEYFTPGNSFTVIETNLGRIGLMICFDIEFPETARALKILGADFLVVVNANMHPYQMYHHIFALSRAMENEIPLIICNRLGQEGDLDFCGDSMVIDATGEKILTLGNEEKIGHTTVPLAQTLDPKMNYLHNRRRELYGILTE